ncbi:hypothetical protein QQF64_025199 [Cirrhinus molitorella]|uniref:Uncharacterized protein n=1 Tax=Cirrhinus molitorella TaxID=172907 RepID=A0ABR3NPF1_9TELE
MAHIIFSYIPPQGFLVHIAFRHKIGGVPALRSKNNILFLSARDSCHSFVVATSRPERFLSDKSIRRGRIVLRSAPSLQICSGRREPFPAPQSSWVNAHKSFKALSAGQHSQFLRELLEQRIPP